MNNAMMPLTRETDASLKDQAYDALEEMIVTLELPAGSAISEAFPEWGQSILPSCQH